VNQPIDVSIQTFLKIRLQPIAEEIAAAGGENLLVGFIPHKGIIHTVGTAAAGTPEYYEQLRLLARQLNDHANKSTPAKEEEKTVAPLILPT
jgi:hypothetical protein